MGLGPAPQYWLMPGLSALETIPIPPLGEVMSRSGSHANSDLLESNQLGQVLGINATPMIPDGNGLQGLVFVGTGLHRNLPGIQSWLSPASPGRAISDSLAVSAGHRAGSGRT